MKHRLIQVAIFSFIIAGGLAGLFDVDQEVDDPTTIEAKSYQYYLGKHKNSVTAKCAVNEMTSYALEGDAEDLGSANELCPNLPNGNCCGREDIERIKTFWKHDTRHQGYYHAAYLKMNRYVLGYSRQYASIANNILAKSEYWINHGIVRNKEVPQDVPEDDNDDQPYRLSYHPQCVKSAQDFIHMDYVDRNKAQIYYRELNRKMEFLQNARRGFYCMLCDAKAKNYILSRRHSPLRASIKFSRDFCEMTHSWLFTATYMLYKSYNPFLKHLFRMLACVSPKTGGKGAQAQNKDLEVEVKFEPLTLRLKLNLKEPQKTLPEKLQKLYSNPLQLRHRKWLEPCYDMDPKDFWFPIRCYNFCDNFKMVKASSLFDGDVDAMEIVYKELEQYEFALADPNENIFVDDVLELKDHIARSLHALGRNYLFYRALNPTIDFSTYTNDFSIFYKGVNPMALSAGSPLEFAYKGVWLLRGAVLAAVLALQSLALN